MGSAPTRAPNADGVRKVSGIRPLNAQNVHPPRWFASSTVRWWVIRGVVNNTGGDGGSRHWLIIVTVQLTSTRLVVRKVNVQVKVGFLYSAAYAMTGPARFTISEVAVDWQEPMVLQRKLRPSNCTR